MMRLFNEQSVEDIADEVREQRGVTDTYTIAELKTAVHNAIQKYKQNNPTNTVNNGVLTNSYDVPILNYKLYGNSTQETRSGKNLFNYLSVGATNQNASINENTKEITLTSGFNASYVLNISDIVVDGSIYSIDLFLNGVTTNTKGLTVVLREDSSTRFGQCTITTNSTDLIYHASFETTSGTIKQLQFYASSSTALNGDITFKIQIRKSSSPDNIYEPYGVMPSPEYPSEIKSVGDLVTEGEHAGKYAVPVVVSGKNLVNLEEVSYSLTPDTFANIDTGFRRTMDNSERSSYTIFKLGKASDFIGKTLTLKADIKNNLSKNIGSWRISIYYGNQNPDVESHTICSTGYKEILANYNQGLEATGEVPTNVTNDLFLFVVKYPSSTFKEWDISFTNIQVEEGTTATSYEPYHTPIVKTLYLEEPLRGIGDVKDELDFARRKVVKKVDRAILTSSLFNNYGGYSQPDNMGYITLSRLDMSPLNKQIKCNYLINSTSAGSGWIRLSTTLTHLQFRNPNCTNKTEYTSWLQSIENNNDNLIIEYTLATPTETDFTPEQNAVADEIMYTKLWEGTNIITLGTEVQPSEINATYITKVGV